jgi:hypothetical protein
MILGGLFVIGVAFLAAISGPPKEQVATDGPVPESTSQSTPEVNLEEALAAFKAGVEELGAAELILNYSAQGKRLTLTVANGWHFQPYQLRLQAAQNLWQGWAQLISPTELDSARLKLVDGNGNEVGGSRIIAGSAIWVKE